MVNWCGEQEKCVPAITSTKLKICPKVIDGTIRSTAGPAPFFVTLLTSFFAAFAFSIAGGRLYVVVSEVCCRWVKKNHSESSVAEICILLWMDPGVRLDAFIVFVFTFIYWVTHLVVFRSRTVVVQCKWLLAVFLGSFCIFLISSLIISQLGPLKFW